jgi:hypothetical protein
MNAPRPRSRRLQRAGTFHRRLTLQRRLLCGLGLALVSCAPQGGEVQPADDDELASRASELITRVQGSTIASPNVDKTKTYLSVRSISTLQTLGALPGALGSLANRVDGVIGSKPADGRFSVSEILRMEQPSYIRTLYPDEKAALPRLWALLETTPLDPTPVNIPNVPAFSTTDVSTPATLPIKPPKLEIPTLPAAVQPHARRLEMVVDSDGDPETITELDIDDPLGDPDPWTAEEIDAFKAIKQLFIARAGTTLKYAVQVPAPLNGKGTVATLGPVTLDVEQSLRYDEVRSASFSRGSSDSSLYIDLSARRASRVNINLGSASHLVLIDVNSETERVVSGPLGWEFSGTAIAEVWSGGTRVGSYRISLPKVASVDERIDLKDFVDYQLVVSGKPLEKNVTTASVRYDSWSTTYSAAFTFDTTALPRPPGVDVTALNRVITPKPNLMPGRYEFSVPSLGTGTCKLDISPEGVVSFTRPGGMPMRARMYIWSYVKFDAQYPDRLRGLYDPQTNNMTVFFDGGGSLFNSTLSGTQRTG